GGWGAPGRLETVQHSLHEERCRQLERPDDVADHPKRQPERDREGDRDERRREQEEGLRLGLGRWGARSTLRKAPQAARKKESERHLEGHVQDRDNCCRREGGGA